MARDSAQRTRSTTLCLLGLLLQPVACAHQEVALHTSQSDSRSAPDLSTDEALRPTLSGTAEAGVLVLKPPPSAERALQVVRQYFRALTNESLEDLARLFAGATPSVEQRRSTAQALATWRSRFARLDYALVANDLLYQERDVQIYNHNAWRALQNQRPFRMAPSEDQLLVVVPMILQTKNKVHYFGNDVQFLLEQPEEELRIVEFREDFRLP